MKYAWHNLPINQSAPFIADVAVTRWDDGLWLTRTSVGLAVAIRAHVAAICSSQSQIHNTLNKFSGPMQSTVSTRCIIHSLNCDVIHMIEAISA